MHERTLFRAGSTLWIVGGIGHLVLIDALTLHGRTRASWLAPHGNILDVMNETTLTFGHLGSTTVFRAMAGYSIWVAVSLVLLGVIYHLVARERGIVLCPFIWAGAVVSLIFTAVAALCFIYPAVAGGAVASALFIGSWVKNEA